MALDVTELMNIKYSEPVIEEVRGEGFKALH